MDLDMTMEGRLGVALPVDATALPLWHQELLLETTSATSPAARRKRQRFGLTTELPGARVYESDRFIPSRRAMDMDYCSFVMETSDATASGSSASACSAAAAAASGCSSSTPRGSSSTSASARGDDPRANLMDNLVRYQETLAANLLFTTPPRKKKTLLRFHERDVLADSVLASPTSVASHPSLAYAGGGVGEAPDASSSSRRRHIPTSPTRILDAPELRDDYYLNLVSWGDHNVLAVALDRVVYLYNTDTGAIQEIKACEARGDYVTSVAWMRSATTSCAGDSGAADSHWLAVGTCRAELQVWDTATATKVRALRGHRDRIGALAWNGAALSSGARDATIRHHDLRVARATTSTTAATTATTLRGHQQEICGLAWSPDGKTLASGGNDNCLCLWDAAMASSSSSRAAAPRARLLQHRAAVKALAWCPWERHLLASGGGTADRTIKFWHAGGAPRLLDSVHTGSQVCGLVWSKTERELLSSHGFSQNELCLWKYPSMVRLREFTGHTARVLHLAMSPDGGSVVSAAADETLRFWNVFSSSKRSTRPGSASLLLAPSDPRRPRGGGTAFFPDAVIR